MLTIFYMFSMVCSFTTPILTETWGCSIVP